MTLLDRVPKLTEKAWMGQLLGLARMFGWAAFHDQATNAPRACPRCRAPIHLPRNVSGWPDLMLIRGDTLIVAELKSDRGRVREDQTGWLSAFRQVRRVVVVVWRPRDAEDAARILR